MLTNLAETPASLVSPPRLTAGGKMSHARKTSPNPVRIYSYRVLPPADPEHCKLVDEQFWLAHQFRGRLTEIELEQRERFRAIDLDHPLTRDAFFLWEAQSASLDLAYEELRAAKSGTSPRHRDLDYIIAVIKEGKIECAKAWRDLKETRGHDSVKDHHKQGYTDARKLADDQRREARGVYSAKGLMHGTYRCIEKAVAQSVDATGRPPHFERYEGEGSIGHQTARRRDRKQQLRSVTANDLYAGKNGQVRMTPLPDGWEELPRSKRRRVAKHYRADARQQKHGDGWQAIPARLDGQYLEMQFRWGPAKRESTWVRFPLTHHRRMPADAEVTWVYIHRWRVGRHFEWRAQLTIESATFHRPATPVAPGDACAIDIGWRRLLDDDGNQVGLRVGYLVDEHGDEREIRAPDGLWQRLAKVYSLTQIRSRELDTIRDRLVTWIDGLVLPECAACHAWSQATASPRVPPPWEGDENRCAGGTCRAWLNEYTRGLPQWRAQRKMQRLADAWKRDERRFDGDGEMLAALLAWAKHDRHLSSWEAHMRDRTIAHRREVWRQIAADLARTYRTIYVEDGLCRSEGRENQMKIVDIDGWDRLPPEEGDPHEGREQRRQSRMAAPGELRLAIAYATHKTASSVIDVARTRRSTSECAWCGCVQKHADFAASIRIKCEGCARVWDQDANAARNLLHRRGLTSGPVPASDPVPPDDEEPLAEDKPAKSRKDVGGVGRRAAKKMK